MRKNSQLRKRDKKRARTIGDCPHPEKAAFLSRQEALRAARIVKIAPIIPARAGTLYPYLCKCTMWHLTSHVYPEPKSTGQARKEQKTCPKPGTVF